MPLKYLNTTLRAVNKSRYLDLSQQVITRKNQMSILDSLKLVTGKRVRHLAPIVQKRNKLIARIQEQMDLCEAHLAGKIYTSKRLKTVTDSQTGERNVIAVTKRLKEWYWMTENGKMNLSLRYGASTLVLGKGGKNAIELESHNHVIDALKLLKNAADLGELDQALIDASSKTRIAFKK
jgi:hypothetical protein